MVSVPGPTRASCVGDRRSAPDGVGGNPSGLEHLISRRSLPGSLHTWACAGSHRFPGAPSYAFALLQDPGRVGKISPWRSRRCCPRATQTEGLNGYIISRLTQGFSIRCLRFTNGVTAAHARTRFRLAGCASTGRGSNPLDRFERFQATSPFSFPGLLLSQGWSTQNHHLAGQRRCSPICRATRTASPSQTAG